MRPSVRPVLAVTALLGVMALGACATTPPERRVRAEFTCDDGRKLSVTFLPDSRAAVLHVQERDVPLTAEPDAPGRAFQGGGFEMHGVGDTITFTSPPSTKCLETR